MASGTKQVKEISPGRVRHDANLFQSAFWARFKAVRGYDTQAFRVNYHGRTVSVVMVHRPCAGDASYGYVPYGPDITLPQERQGRFLEFLSEAVRPRMPRDCSFLRFDLPWESPYAPSNERRGGWEGPPEPRVRELRMNFGCRHWNLRKALTDIQPPDTVVLDLGRSARSILLGLHRKARYCVRRAFRRGVVVETAGVEALPRWHRLYSETARRKGIVAEEPAYFRDLFDTARSDHTELRIYLGSCNGELLSGSLLVFQPETATYLFSASNRRGRTLTASYAVLWKALMDARAQGCRWFDFFGIPPNDDPHHPMHGLFRFKTRFGGEIRHFRGCWDYPFDEERYFSLALPFGGLDAYHAG
ncbi:MAG: peptidoglycan bridge formation glycyltransferase FemA/FemB family protein [Deltaproteobacteria bacterium]|nr:peptidoglycan bridge formation glycyltransferase FemA/FemB family protein [Deltaproteobacteria bacterium]